MPSEATLPPSVDDILKLVDSSEMKHVPGMASHEALPVRTTFLHLLYPSVVPIFDQMVLRAVGFATRVRTKKGCSGEILEPRIDPSWATYGTPSRLSRVASSACGHGLMGWAWRSVSRIARLGAAGEARLPQGVFLDFPRFCKKRHDEK